MPAEHYASSGVENLPLLGQAPTKEAWQVGVTSRCCTPWYLQISTQEFKQPQPAGQSTGGQHCVQDMVTRPERARGGNHNGGLTVSSSRKPGWASRQPHIILKSCVMIMLPAWMKQFASTNFASKVGAKACRTQHDSASRQHMVSWPTFASLVPAASQNLSKPLPKSRV